QGDWSSDVCSSDLDARVEVGELVLGQRAHVAAGRLAARALPEDARQLFEREAEGERAPHDLHALDGGARVASIAIGAARGGGDGPFAFVMPNGVGTHPARARQITNGQLVLFMHA